MYFEDMADGNVYVWDSKTLKTVDKMPIGKAVCGIQWTKNDKKAYITDMPTGIVYVYDWKTKKEIKQISSPEMTFIHQARMTPDGRYLWVSAPNEFDPGLKPGTHKSQIIVIDTKTDTITKRIVLPDNVRPHDFAFTHDGKYAFVASRTYGDDSTMVVMNTKNDKIERNSIRMRILPQGCRSRGQDRQGLAPSLRYRNRLAYRQEIVLFQKQGF